MGDEDGKFHYFENTETSTRPEFVQRTEGANPFDGIENYVGWNSAPAFGDLDGDGTLKPCRSIDKQCPHVSCLAQATWTSWWALVMARSHTWRTPNHL